jgi:hypothetical protein
MEIKKLNSTAHRGRIPSRMAVQMVEPLRDILGKIASPCATRSEPPHRIQTV